MLISDACRTAAEGIQGQSIRGSEIFPNVADSGQERPVDVFYACGLGDPALEVKSAKKAASGYRAVYTDSLVEALEGRKNVIVKDPDTLDAANLIEVDGTGKPARGLVRLVAAFVLPKDRRPGSPYRCQGETRGLADSGCTDHLPEMPGWPRSRLLMNPPLVRARLPFSEPRLNPKLCSTPPVRC